MEVILQVVIMDYPIKVSGVDDEDVTNQYQYYAWQTNEMDKFLRKLPKALKTLVRIPFL